MCGRCTQRCSAFTDCMPLNADCRSASDVLACDIEASVCAPVDVTSCNETTTVPTTTVPDVTLPGVDAGEFDADLDAAGLDALALDVDAADAPGPYGGDEAAAPWPTEPNLEIPLCREVPECAWGEPAVVPGYIENTTALLGADASGRAALLLVESPTGDRGSLAVTQMSGSEWGEATVLSASRPGAQTVSPCFGVNGSGAMVAAWVQATSDVYESRVWGTVFDEVNGWAPPIPLSPRPGSIGAVGCGIDATGAAMIAWWQADQTVDHFFVAHLSHGESSTAELGSIGVEFKLSVAASGHALLLWSYQDDTTGVAAVHYEPNVGWGAEQRFDVEADFEIANIALALNADGSEGRAVWLERPPPGPAALWSGRFTRAGWGPKEQVSVAADGLGEVQVGVDGEGAAVVVWQAIEAVDAEHDTSRLLFNRYDPDSGWSGPEVLVSSAEEPSLAMNERGDFVTVWVTPSEVDVSTGPQYVGVRSFISGVWSDSVALPSWPFTTAWRPAVTLSNSGEANVVWTDWSGPFGYGGVLWVKNR